MSATVTCPACRRGTLQLVTDGQVGHPVAGSSDRRDAETRIVWRSRPFAACDRCECCIEISVR